MPATESDVSIPDCLTQSKPKGSGTFYNQKMKICRELLLACLHVAVEDHKNLPLLCLDAFAASGVAGLQWKKWLKDKVNVTLNDLRAESCDVLRIALALNGFSEENFSISQEDAFVHMGRKQYHFIYLDPFGSTAPYLAAACRNLYSGGCLVLTSTDVATLLGRNPQVLLRNYGATTVRCEFSREIAVRIVIAELVRSAARCHKGVEVLYCAAAEHFIQVAVRLHRSALLADFSIGNVKSIRICQVCHLYRQLRDASCYSSGIECCHPLSCHSAIGPLWCGSIFSSDVLLRMSDFSRQALSPACASLVGQLQEEAQFFDTLMASVPADGTCAPAKIARYEELVPEGVGGRPGQGKASSPGGAVCQRGENPVGNLFYRSLSSKQLGFANIPRVDLVVEELRRKGLAASRTHFDRTAIRADCPVARLREIVVAMSG